MPAERLVLVPANLLHYVHKHNKLSAQIDHDQRAETGSYWCSSKESSVLRLLLTDVLKQLRDTLDLTDISTSSHLKPQLYYSASAGKDTSTKMRVFFSYLHLVQQVFA